jgi:four helix bundle protein
MNVHLLPFQTLDVYQCSKELAVTVHRCKIGDSELRDQARRASKSVLLNIAEGLPNHTDGLRRRHFTLARNSACETSGAVDVAMAIGAIDEATALDIMRRCHRVYCMLTKMLR